MQQLTTLVYMSSAKRQFEKVELEALLQQSRTNNEKQGLTGLLLYKDGLFMQALEGSHDSITKIFPKITADPRHHNVITLLNTQLERRNFERWTMGFEYFGNLSPELSDHFEAIWNQPFTPAYFGHYPHNALKLLLKFRKNMKAESVLQRNAVPKPVLAAIQ